MRGSSFFITSDTHFNHHKLVNTGFRPEDCDKRIVDNLKAVIKPDDVLIHLGDVTWSSVIDPDFVALPCRKILVKGNHDKKGYFWYMKRGFDFVCETFTLSYSGQNILFSHKPIEIDYNSFGYDYNIHGHLHGGQHGLQYSWTREDGKHHLISLEDNGYKPELLDKILAEFRKKEL